MTPQADLRSKPFDMVRHFDAAQCKQVHHRSLRTSFGANAQGVLVTKNSENSSKLAVFCANFSVDIGFWVKNEGEGVSLYRLGKMGKKKMGKK